MPASRTTTTRVTPKKVKPIDLDARIAAILAEETPDEITVTPIITVDLLGQTFALNAHPNAWLGLQMAADPDDVSPIYHFMIDLVIDEDRKRFLTAMAQQGDMTAKRVGAIFRTMMEAVAEGNPTNTSSGSKPSAKRTAGKALSAGS